MSARENPLRAWLERKEITISDFADRIGTSGAYLGHILAGRRWPSVKLACRIEKATRGEVTAADLLFFRRVA